MKLSSLFALVTFAASAALALSPSDSWETIRNTRGVFIPPASVYETYFGSEGFFNACVDGQVLRSIKPVASCTNFTSVQQSSPAHGQSSSICTQTGSGQVVVPLAQSFQTCDSYRRSGNGQDICQSTSTVNALIPLTYSYQVVVMEVSGGAPRNQVTTPRTLFNKVYTIPNCQ